MKESKLVASLSSKGTRGVKIKMRIHQVSDAVARYIDKLERENKNLKKEVAEWADEFHV